MSEMKTYTFEELINAASESGELREGDAKYVLGLFAQSLQATLPDAEVERIVALYNDKIVISANPLSMESLMDASNINYAYIKQAIHESLALVRKK